MGYVNLVVDVIIITMEVLFWRPGFNNLAEKNPFPENVLSWVFGCDMRTIDGTEMTMELVALFKNTLAYRSYSECNGNV